MAAFTSKSTGNWDAEGQTTWNEAGHPGAGDTVTIQNGHTVTLDSATACTTLTIDAGGTLTDATNNQGLTVSGITTIEGTLTCGTANMSFGSGATASFAITINSGGIFTGGSGAHTIGSIYNNTGTLTLTSGITTINSALVANDLAIALNSGTFNHGSGTVTFTMADDQLLFDTNNTARTFYNLIVNKPAGNFQFENGNGYHLTVANDLTITSGEFDTKETISGTSRDLTVVGKTIVSDTLTCNASTISLGSGKTQLVPMLDIKAGGTFNGGSGTHTIGNVESITATSTLTMTSGNCTIDGGQSGTQFEISSNSTFNHNNGTLILAYPHHLFVDSQSLYNLTIDHALGDTHLDADLTVENDLTITAGGFETDDDGGPSYDVSVGGNVTINGGNMECKSSTTIDFDGNVTIGAGTTLEAPTGTLSFSGDTWTNNGTFTHRDGTVVFNGGNQAIVGSNTWYNFSKTWAVASTITLTVDNTSTQTFEKNVTLEAASAISRISIVSDSAGNAFDFVMTATAVKTALDYLSIKDSDASGSDASHKPIAPGNSIDVSGNTDWFASSPPPTPMASGKGGFKSKKSIIIGEI